MAESRRIAPTIKVGDLSKALQKAFAVGAKEHGVGFAPEIVALEGGFFGAVMQAHPAADIDPMAVAASITQKMGSETHRVPGAIAWPTANWPEGPILVGFWDPPPRYFNI